MAHLGLLTKPKLVGGLLGEGTEEDPVGHMACSVDGFGPKPPRSAVLIKHRPSHLHQSLILPLDDTVLGRNIRRRKLVLKTQRRAEGLKVSVLELGPIVSANGSHDAFGKLTFQPKNQSTHKGESLILGLHEKDPRIARKVIHDHKHVPFPTQ